MKPVAPVTRTRTARPRRDRRPEQPQQADAGQRALRPPVVNAPRSDRLVQRDRQHELPVDASDAEAVAAECASRIAPSRRTRGRPRRSAARGARSRVAPTAWSAAALHSRRVVEDDALAGDAAQLAEALPPVGRVHQHAQADGGVERPVRKARGGARRRPRRSPATSPRSRALRARRRSISRRRVDAGDVRRRAAASGQRRAAGAGADVEHAPSGDGRGTSASTRSCVSASSSPIGPPNRSASKRVGHRGIGVDRVAVVIGAAGRGAGSVALRPLPATRRRLGRGRSANDRDLARLRQVRLVAVLRLGQLARAGAPSSRAAAGSPIARRMPAANASGVGLGQDRHARRRAPACASAAAWRRSAGRTAGTGRSSAACSCRGSAATPARRRRRGTAGSPRRAARRRRSSRRPRRPAAPAACACADLLRAAAGQQEPRVGRAAPRRAPRPRTAGRAPGRPRTCRCRGPPAPTRPRPNSARNPRRRCRRPARRPSPGAFSISTGSSAGSIALHGLCRAAGRSR